MVLSCFGFGFRFRVSGSEFIQGLEFRVWDLGFRFRVQDKVFRVGAGGRGFRADHEREEGGGAHDGKSREYPGREQVEHQKLHHPKQYLQREREN